MQNEIYIVFDSATPAPPGSPIAHRHQVEEPAARFGEGSDVGAPHGRRAITGCAKYGRYVPGRGFVVFGFARVRDSICAHQPAATRLR